MNTIISFFRDYVAWLTIPDFTITDVLEIAIIAFAFYHIILWIKDTRAWVLLKGMVDSWNYFFSGTCVGNECCALGIPECDGSRNYGTCCHFSAGT